MNMPRIAPKIFRKKARLPEPGVDGIPALDAKLRLISFVIRADGVYNNFEKKFVRDYFNERYPAFADEIENRIEFYSDRYRGIPLSAETAALSSINESLVQGEKLAIIVMLFSLACVDVINDLEIEAMRSIASSLDIDETWFDMVYYMHLVQWPPSRGPHQGSFPDAYNEATGRMQSISLGEGIECDVRARGAGTARAAVYRLGGYFYMGKTAGDAEQGPLINNIIAADSIIHPLNPGSRLVFGRAEFSLDDIHHFFRNKYRSAKKTHRLRLEGSVIRLSSAEEPCDLILRIESNSCHLEPASDIVVSINGTPVPRGTNRDVLYGDEILIDDRVRLDLKKAASLREDRPVSAQIITGGSPYTITNYDPSSGFFIRGHSVGKIEMSILIRGGAHYLRVERSPEPVHINHIRVQGEAPLEHRSRISTGPILLLWDGEHGTLQQIGERIHEISVSGLSCSAAGKRLIDEVGFRVETGDLLCIMGPSGSGKTTLLKLLCGIIPPSNGKILYNGASLGDNLKALRRHIGFVPQDDLLFENLTVYENLYYRARIVNPYLDRKSIDGVIDGLLVEFNLFEVRNVRAGGVLDKTLSGGQRKRVNIALELLGDPDVLLLDEPTSGLSSHDSEVIIQHLAGLSGRGKIVIASVHQPGQTIFPLFNRLIVIDNGGKLAFEGSTRDGIEYFLKFAGGMRQKYQCGECGSMNPELIFTVMEEPLRKISGEALTRKGPDGIAIPLRKYPPEFWRSVFEKHLRSANTRDAGDRDEAADAGSIPRQDPEPVFPWKQFMTLFIRDARNRLRSMSFLTISGLQVLLAPLLAVIFRYAPEGGYTLRDNKFLPYFLFMSAISVLFISLSNSIDEIVRERPVFFRESMLNIQNRAYYFAKVCTLFSLSLVQLALYTLLCLIIMKIELRLFPLYFLVYLLTALQGICMGLFFSSLARTSISAFIPLIVIIQIVLGGALIEYGDMKLVFVDKTRSSPEVSQLITAKWSYEALVLIQANHNSYTYWENLALEDISLRSAVEERKLRLRKAGIFEKNCVNERIRILVREANKLFFTGSGNVFLSKRFRAGGQGSIEAGSSLPTLSTLALDIFMLAVMTSVFMGATLLNMRRRTVT